MSDENETRPHGLSRVPYGPPIHDAIASGDLRQMKAVAEAARYALGANASVTPPAERLFDRVTKNQRTAVADALRTLDEAIDRLERMQGPDRGR